MSVYGATSPPRRLPDPLLLRPRAGPAAGEASGGRSAGAGSAHRLASRARRRDRGRVGGSDRAGPARIAHAGLHRRSRRGGDRHVRRRGASAARVDDPRRAGLGGARDAGRTCRRPRSRRRPRPCPRHDAGRRASARRALDRRSRGAGVRDADAEGRRDPRRQPLGTRALRPAAHGDGPPRGHRPGARSRGGGRVAGRPSGVRTARRRLASQRRGPRDAVGTEGLARPADPGAALLVQAAALGEEGQRRGRRHGLRRPRRGAGLRRSAGQASRARCPDRSGDPPRRPGVRRRPHRRRDPGAPRRRRYGSRGAQRRLRRERRGSDRGRRLVRRGRLCASRGSARLWSLSAPARRGVRPAAVTALRRVRRERSGLRPQGGRPWRPGRTGRACPRRTGRHLRRPVGTRRGRLVRVHARGLGPGDRGVADAARPVRAEGVALGAGGRRRSRPRPLQYELRSARLVRWPWMRKLPSRRT